jgi:hypothetical protein
MYSSEKHSLTNFDTISHVAVILYCTNILNIRHVSVISFARYDLGVIGLKWGFPNYARHTPFQSEDRLLPLDSICSSQHIETQGMIIRLFLRN